MTRFPDHALFMLPYSDVSGNQDLLQCSILTTPRTRYHRTPPLSRPVLSLSNLGAKHRRLTMWIVAIAWMYVAIMMTLAEATHPQGTILGAIITFLFYGVAPVAIVMYILGTPGRRRARRAAEAQAEAARQASLASAAEGTAQGNASSHAPRDPVTTEGKEAPRL
jgi:hypothetical protein